MPPQQAGGRIVTITPIFELQVDQLLQTVLRLERSQGQDRLAYDAIRRTVSGELLNQDRLEVASAALGALPDGAAADRLSAIIAHCAESFYLADRVLTAVVMPVAFRMTSPVAGSVALSQGDAGHLRTLARMVQQTSGARQVVFDTRLYDSAALHFVKASTLLNCLLQLEAGVTTPEPGPTACVLRSETEPAWYMRYFLGVEVTSVAGPRQFNDDILQRRLHTWSYHAEWALTQTMPLLLNRQASAEAHCHGIWYLGRGLQVGENLIRGYRLQSTLSNFDQGRSGVQFYYLHEVLSCQVKLMLCSEAMTAQHTWKLFGDESLDGFRQELNRAIELLLPPAKVRAVVQLEQSDYEQRAAENGLCWLRGVLP